MKLTKNDDLPSSALPPADVVEDMLALNLPLLRLAGMTGNPVFDADWRLIDTPGYQPRPASSSSRTAATFHRCLNTPPPAIFNGQERSFSRNGWTTSRLLTDSSWTHAVAAPLTRVVRGQIDGPTPLTAVDAPTARSGKGLLVECIGVTGTGFFGCGSNFAKRISRSFSSKYGDPSPCVVNLECGSQIDLTFRPPLIRAPTGRRLWFSELVSHEPSDSCFARFAVRGAEWESTGGLASKL